MEKEETLKTLEDKVKEILERKSWNTPILIFQGELRQEAIKWIKAESKINCIGSEDVERRFMEFFNINAEDLQ